MKKVIVFGTFDILHPGHVHMLKEAKEYGDLLVVVVARDETVCNVKGKKPIYDEKTRTQNLQRLKIADKIRLGCLGDKYEVLRDENPDIVALGYDQKVFVDNLEEVIPDHAQIVRLNPYNADVFKSSKLREFLESLNVNED